MSKRLFIEDDFAQAERRTLASSLIYCATPGYVYVCTDDGVRYTFRSERQMQEFKNATAIETEGYEQEAEEAQAPKA